MTAVLVECSVRAALIAIGTAAVLSAMRIKTPSTRHAAWTAVVAAMLLLPMWSSLGPRLSLRVLRPPALSAAAVATPTKAVPRVASPAAAAVPGVPDDPEPGRRMTWQDALVGFYLAGAGALLARLAIGAAQARRLRRSAVVHAGHATSARCVTPITIGWLTPTLILPVGWQHWPSAMLEAVLTHEREHARRRDPLVQLAALVNRAVFWFHPLAWWVERRLSTLAEEACDAVVLEAGHSPQNYSSYLLDLARSVAHQGRRVHVVGLAMPGSGLKQRMRQILADTPAPRISRVRVFCTLACCAASSGLFAAATLTPRTSSQPSALAFEVASVIPNQSSDARSPSLIASGGRFTATNNTLRTLILNAYGISATPYLLIGGPGWIDSAKYDVEAKAAAGAIPADASNRVLWEQTRLMLRTLLADRFKLAVRRETKDMPVYRLVASKSGRKLRESQRDCSADANACHGFSGNPTRLSGSGVDMSDLASWLSRYSDRPVIDGTGIAGVFDVSLQWNPFADGVASTADVARAPGAESREGPRPDLSSLPALSTALEEQLGLKLESTKGPVDTYVIDGVERPSAGGSAMALAAPQVPLPKFEAVSIKPCKGGELPPGRRGAGPGNGAASPGRLHIDCLPLVGRPSLIRQAYAVHATGRLAAVWVDLPIEGGPAWAQSDRFTIEAKAEGTPGPDMMRGPMLQVLLEERFQLKTHRETRPIPVYELSVAKGGAKLRPFDGHCTPVDFTKGNLPAQLEAAGACPISVYGTKVDAPGETIEDFIRFVLTFMDRPVVDKTGLSGRFDIHLELPPDLTSDEVPSALASALQQQLGLKITPAKGPGDFLVIDHVERPDAGR